MTIFKKNIINNQEVLKCGAGERWRRSAGPITWEIKNYCMELRRARISYKK
jgi:hypothetical protein